jgi:pimeloyl-ACP methyl ester carboxylesterase
MRLHIAEAGPADGPPVILLHGFPEFWFGWRHQIHALADAGYHIIVPDQRGYNLSDKPAGVRSYDLDRLAADVIGLANAFNATQFSIVGHDWGAGVGWWVAEQHPDRLQRLAVLNAPHPAIWRTAMDHDPEQRRLSRYVRLLGVRVLPEMLIRAGRFKGLEVPLRDSTRGLPAEELARYREAWKQPGALTAMINWYRAILMRTFVSPIAKTVQVPTQLIWGAKDKYAAAHLMEASLALCRSGNLTVLPGATHWVQHDESKTVNEILLDFLK